MTDHDPLASFRIGSEVSLAQASPWLNEPVTPESPALRVMTDLTYFKAATIRPSIALRDAEKMMIFQGVRMLFVVTTMPMIEGLITTTDIYGNEALRLAQERGLRFDELSVGDVMTPLDRLDAVDFDAVRRGQVGNVIATLQRLGRNHLLVVQAPDAVTPRRVRGVMSRTQVERQLGQPIAITPIASSFAEIGRALG